MREIALPGRKIGTNNPPLVVAEMSGNHNQSLERALEIVEAAGKPGAHALKIQTYTADTMTLDIDQGEFYIDERPTVYGKGVPCTSSTSRLTRLGNGINQFLIVVKNWASLDSVLPLTTHL